MNFFTENSVSLSIQSSHAPISELTLCVLYYWVASINLSLSRMCLLRECIGTDTHAQICRISEARNKWSQRSWGGWGGGGWLSGIKHSLTAHRPSLLLQNVHRSVRISSSRTHSLRVKAKKLSINLSKCLHDQYICIVQPCQICLWSGQRGD